MDILLVLLIEAAIVVNLVDISGFVNTVKHWIWKWVFNGKRAYQDFDFRPFECSYCMTHHIGVITLLVLHSFTLPNYCFLLFLCYVTTTIKDIFILTRDILTKIIDTIYYWLSL